MRLIFPVATWPPRTQTPPHNGSQPNGCRAGFTLVEILVVIAIIGILVALLLPAVQAAREAARRTQCKSQLKQLALGMMLHHDTQKHFPTGGWGWSWVGDPDRGYGQNQPGGWVYNILDYIEEGSLRSLGADGDPETLSRDQRDGARIVVQSPIDIVNCPSRRAAVSYPLTANQGGAAGLRNALTPDVAGRSDYAANAGTGYNQWPDGTYGAGPPSYAAARTFEWGATVYPGSDDGISFERSQVRIRQITDGLTNVYLIGERYIPTQHYMSGEWIGDNETWCTGFNNDNYRSTGFFSGGPSEPLGPLQDTTDDDQRGDRRFGSAHPSVWNVAYCDGSVDSVGYDIDERLHFLAGSRNDGQVTSDN